MSVINDSPSLFLTYRMKRREAAWNGIPKLLALLLLVEISDQSGLERDDVSKSAALSRVICVANRGRGNTVSPIFFQDNFLRGFARAAFAYFLFQLQICGGEQRPHTGQIVEQ